MKLNLIFGALALTICMTSCAQKPKAEAHVNKTEPATDSMPNTAHMSQATFAAGCFWHEETLFESIKGVREVVSGYAGGKTKNPTYEDVETGTTGHAETVNIYYDSSKITYPTLLKIFFEAQDDPTQVDGQGNDEGTQYRSIIFYRNEGEKKMAEDYIRELNQSGQYRKPIAAQVVPYTVFWRAEDYHQHYIDHNADNPYVANVSIPDIRRYQKAHPDMIKPGHSFVK
jgi:peptide-methionine (S)-S-oxide reductase